MEEALERVRGGRGRVAGQRPRGAEDEDAAPGYSDSRSGPSGHRPGLRDRDGELPSKPPPATALRLCCRLLTGPPAWRRARRKAVPRGRRASAPGLGRTGWRSEEEPPGLASGFTLAGVADGSEAHTWGSSAAWVLLGPPPIQASLCTVLSPSFPSSPTAVLGLEVVGGWGRQPLPFHTRPQMQMPCRGQ